jgi:hypothetical protein
VHVSELERLEQAQGLVHTPPHWQVVDGLLPEDALRADDEEAAEGDAGVLTCARWGGGVGGCY